MKKLLCNSLIASVVAVAGAAGFAGEAKAQLGPDASAGKSDVEVEFNGTVGSLCEISKVAGGDGVIGLDDVNPRNYVLSSRSDEFSGGQLGEVKINCNGSGSVSIGALEAVSADAIALASTADQTFYRAELYESNSNFDDPIVASGDTAVSRTLNGTEESLYVHMVVYNGENAAIPDGVYQFKTTVSVTPQ